MSKYGVFSGPSFPAFGLNTERYSASLCSESEYGKRRTRKNSVFGHFYFTFIYLLKPRKSCSFNEAILGHIKNDIRFHLLPYSVSFVRKDKLHVRIVKSQQNRFLLKRVIEIHIRNVSHRPTFTYGMFLIVQLSHTECFSSSNFGYSTASGFVAVLNNDYLAMIFPKRNRISRTKTITEFSHFSSSVSVTMSVLSYRFGDNYGRNL